MTPYRKTKHAEIAKEHLEQVSSWLAAKDPSLAVLASEHIPQEDPSPEANKKESKNKKRKADDQAGIATKKANVKSRNKTNGELTLGEREDDAMQALFEFIEEKGGSREAVANFRCRVSRKPSDGRYDTNYYNEQGRRFRSMMEVGRYLNLVADNSRSAAGKKKVSFKNRKVTTRDIENEKKRLRKELEKLRKQHTKATKALDEFLTEDKESRYPVEDLVLQEEEEDSSNSQKISPSNCAAARIPDVDGFSGVPLHCVPDVLMSWDFACTFSRAISVNPIALDDFVYALTYKAPYRLEDSDPFSSPPIYIGELHLGLLKLLLSDPSSDDWWWSILETDETENLTIDLGEGVGKEDNDLPLIKVDFAALLAEPEDPLITTSWIQNLEEIRALKETDKNAMRHAVKTATNVVANKFVQAYLRKSIKLGKTSGCMFMKRAVIWLLDRFRDARPDLFDRSVSKNTLFKQRAKVVDEVAIQMERVSAAALSVNDDDLVSDVEESDDESDDSDDEEENNTSTDSTQQDEPDDKPASYIPLKPLPTLVDLLLPPGKPVPPSDLLSPFSWSQLAGAAACRILHRYKRLRNEVDDSLRRFRELPRLTVAQRRQREAISTSRVLAECFVNERDENPCEKAVEHLCAGGNYLELSTLQRICILRILIEAAYDTARVYEVVDSNYKQRTNAAKALDNEQKRAKREAKEKAAADEAAARQDLALEARRNFVEDKREEIRKANEHSQELTSQEIDSLTEEDILEFDEDFKADYDALPTPESFKKAEVVARVAKIQEAAAFETESLTVLTMDELLERERRSVEALQDELQALGGEDALLDPSLDRETSRAIERIRRELGKIRTVEHSLPLQREAAVDALRDAIADGTIKSLRNAIKIAKTAKLFGPDYETNGVWSLDIVRDAHTELEEARQLKRVADAQKDLISKLNKCFIRTEPLGLDRYRNRFWKFDSGERGHVWVEVDYVLKEGDCHPRPHPGFLDLASDINHVAIGAADMEEDLGPTDESETLGQFQIFSRREYHASGAIARLVKRHWGCHVNESSLRNVMKGLDSRGVRENQLKKNLKEALEDTAITQDNNSNEPSETKTNEKESIGEVDTEKAEEDEDEDNGMRSSGDENAFKVALESARRMQSDLIKLEYLENLSSAIGQHVRVRFVIEVTKDNEVARYEVGKITGWKLRKDTEPVQPDGDEFEPETRIVMTPVWRAWTDRGNEALLTGSEMLDSISRYVLWSSTDLGYFESDAAFLAYRNSLGRHFGRAADAPHATTPYRFAQLMIRREAELYARLKQRFYDNNWGGKSGSRNAWLASMKDFAYDFQTVRDGLLTLENAFFELTDGIAEENGVSTPSGQELLENPAIRNDIELESLEKNVGTLWNSKDSRAVFVEIVTSKSIRDCHRTINLKVG